MPRELSGSAFQGSVWIKLKRTPFDKAYADGAASLGFSTESPGIREAARYVLRQLWNVVENDAKHMKTFWKDPPIFSSWGQNVSN